MKRQRILSVIWIATTVFCIVLVPQLRADEHAKPNEIGWVQTNGPYGGNIRSFYAASKGVLLAGTWGAGIFRSTNRGNTWTPVNTGLAYEPGEGFVYVEVFAQKGEVLYVGTQGGLYASTDGSNTWHHVPNFRKSESISGIAVSYTHLTLPTIYSV